MPMSAGPAAVFRSLKKPLPKAKGIPTLTWAKRFKERFKWSDRAISAPTGFLAFHCKKMKAFRQNYLKQLDAQGINPRLVLNYDQVWRLRWRGPKKILHKAQKDAGQSRATAAHRSKRKQVQSAVKQHREISIWGNQQAV